MSQQASEPQASSSTPDTAFTQKPHHITVK